MSVLAAPGALATELWLSFASLLRSYAGANSINSTQPIQVTVGENSIVVTVAGALLNLRYDPTRAAGDWELSSGREGATRGLFSILPEGSARLDGTMMDLDHAAIDLIARVTRAATGKGR
jgi:hypothetical protein